MNSIQKNFLYNVSYQILGILLPLITAPYISRVLGATELGVYSYTYSVAYYFILIGTLGMTNLGNRSIAAVREEKENISRTFWNLYALQFTAFVIPLAIYAIYIIFFAKYQIIAAIQAIYVISSLFDISWFFFGLEKFKLTVTRNIIIKIATVCCVFIFVKQSTDVWKYAVIMALGTFLSQIYLWIYLDKYVTKPKISFDEIKKYIKPLFVLFVPVIAYMIYKVMDKIILGNISTIEQVGYYENALKVINIPMGVISALGTVMLPRMTAIASNGESGRVEKYIRISIKFVTLLASAICCGLIGISNNLAITYFGPEYTICGPLISLLSITCFFMAWANVGRTQYLIPYKLDNIYLLSTGLGAVFNLILNLILIPKFAAQGAAIGTIAAEFSVMAIQVIALRKYIKIYEFIYNSFGYIGIGIIMAVVVRFLSNTMSYGWASLCVEILVGVVIYIGLMLVYMKGIKDELLEMLMGMIRRKYIKNR